MTAYQITSMMEAWSRAARATVMREVGKPIAGKTAPPLMQKISGSSALSSISWSVSIWLRQASQFWAEALKEPHGWPIARDFMKFALADKPAIPSRSAGIKIVRVDPKSGMRAVGRQGYLDTSIGHRAAAG